MKSLRALHPLFLKYKYAFLLGILFVAISNYFAVLPPAIIRNLLDGVQQKIVVYKLVLLVVLEFLIISFSCLGVNYE